MGRTIFGYLFLLLIVLLIVGYIGLYAYMTDPDYRPPPPAGSTP